MINSKPIGGDFIHNLTLSKDSDIGHKSYDTFALILCSGNKVL